MRHHQKSHPDETEQRTEIPPGIGKPIVAVQKILIDLDKMTYRKQERSVIDRSIHGWSRKSYTRQGRSQRSDHRHDTDNDTDRRKRENRKTASACVAITNRIEVRFNGQNPQENGIFIGPNIT